MQWTARLHAFDDEIQNHRLRLAAGLAAHRLERIEKWKTRFNSGGQFANDVGKLGALQAWSARTSTEQPFDIGKRISSQSFRAALCSALRQWFLDDFSISSHKLHWQQALPLQQSHSVRSIRSHDHASCDRASAVHGLMSIGRHEWVVLTR